MAGIEYVPLKAVRAPGQKLNLPGGQWAGDGTKRGKGMLTKLIQLRNVGLLRSGAPKPVAFEQVTLLYAENGRGKSTIANILRAAASLDADALEPHQTIDSDEKPLVEMLFVDGQGAPNPLALSNGAWSGSAPAVHVFDPGFVESNVFSGQEIRADQRQSLLQFALGEDAVNLEKRLASLVPQIAEATKRETDAGKRIAAFAKGMLPQDFIKLQGVPDAQAKIDSLRSRIEAAKNLAPLSQRPMPEPLPQIELDIAALFKILQTDFEGVREDAKEAVQAHFQRHGNPDGLEAWVAQGRGYVTGEDCPFCGSDLEGADLLTAYDAYFNEAYNATMKQVGALSRGVEARLSDDKIEIMVPQLAANEARVKAWADQLELEVPRFDLELARSSVTALRAAAADLAIRKQQSPLEPVGTDTDVATATNMLRQIRQQITAYNDAINVLTQRIRQYLAQLNTESPAALAQSVTRLEAAIARQTKGAVQAVHDFETAEKAKKALNAEKLEARKALDQLLPKTLSVYQGRINNLLRRFGAGFEIVRLEPDYTGGTLRSDYALQIRGRSVEVGKKAGAGKSFGRMLSEGDKRTLALSFFLAKMQGLPGDLSGKTIVFDDPMCSFDHRRREATIASIVEVVARGAQVLVLCHDPHFLNDLRRRLSRSHSQIKPVVHEIRRVKDDYSELGPCDLDKICESDYQRAHRMVREYVDGQSSVDRRSLAKELRPLMEGFLKRRFPPPILEARANLGGIIKSITEGAHPKLAHAKQYVGKLDALNQFDTRFHHDDGNEQGAPNDAELQQFAKMTLDVIYGDYSAP